MNKTEIIMDKETKNYLLEFISWSLFNKNNVNFIKENIFGFTLINSFIFIIIWLIVAKIFNLFTNFEFGWNTEHKGFILVGIIITSFFYSFFKIIINFINLKPSKKIIKEIKKDLEKNKIYKTSYEIKNIKVFKEPEHGGYIYYLLTTKNEIIVVYDSESQDLSMEGKNPKNSSYKPRRFFEIFKTKYSKLLIKDYFKGEILNFPEPEIMKEDPKNWPEHGSIIMSNWDDI